MIKKLTEFECGCKVYGGLDTVGLVYCPQHAAAPQMFEAVHKVAAFADMAIDKSVNILEAFDYIDGMVKECIAAIELATGDNDD